MNYVFFPDTGLCSRGRFEKYTLVEGSKSILSPGVASCWLYVSVEYKRGSMGTTPFLPVSNRKITNPRCSWRYGVPLSRIRSLEHRTCDPSHSGTNDLPRGEHDLARSRYSRQRGLDGDECRPRTAPSRTGRPT